MSQLSQAKEVLARIRAIIASGPRDVSMHVADAAGALDTHRVHIVRELSRLPADARVITGRHPERFAPWDDVSFWAGWACRPAVPSELRVGELIDPLGIPATVPILCGQTVVLTTHDEAAAQRARGVLRSLALRAAATLGNRVVLHLIDPHQEGFGFPERGHLPQSAARTLDVTRDLKAVIDAGYAFQQRHPGLEFDRLDASADEPVHLVLAQDFPRSYGHQAVEHLNRIAKLWPTGVQLVVHHHVTATGPVGSHLDLVNPVVVAVDGQGRGRDAWGALVANLDAAPTLLQTAAVAAKLPKTAEATGGDDEPTVLAWREVNSTDNAAWWQGDASHEVRAVIGRTVSGDPLEIALGQDAAGDSRSHVVVAGTTGSGKGVLLHSAILSLATRYRPDELRFYLLDGQNGVTMQAYAHLPHADLVTLYSPIDLVRGVLADVGAELSRRDGLLMQAGVDNIADYWKVSGRRQMPRLIVVIDEYQSLFDGDRRDEAARILQRITAQGRKVGLHLLLASQRFHASGLLNQSALFDNIQTRISLKLNTDTIDGLDEFDREGRELIRSHATARGKVVINAQGGAQGASVAGLVAFADAPEIKALVSRLAARTDAGPRRRPVLINGQEQPRQADSTTLAALGRVDAYDEAALRRWAESDTRAGGLAVSAWQPYDHPFVFIVGRTFSVFGPAAAKVDRAANHNVMLVASDPEILTGMTLTGIASAAMSVRPRRLTVALACELPPPGSWAGILREGLPELLRRRGHDYLVPGDDTDAVAVLEAAVTEVDRRNALDPVALAACGPYLFVALGAERIAAFRVTEGHYGPEQSEAGEKLQRLLKEGPHVGVHGVIGFTSRAAWARVMPDKGRNQFVHRFVQQLSEEDSRVLLDTSFGFKIMPSNAQGPQRAGYNQSEAGSEVVFLPYTTARAPLQALNRFIGGKK